MTGRRWVRTSLLPSVRGVALGVALGVAAGAWFLLLLALGAVQLAALSLILTLAVLLALFAAWLRWGVHKDDVGPM